MDVVLEVCAHIMMNVEWSQRWVANSSQTQPDMPQAFCTSDMFPWVPLFRYEPAFYHGHCGHLLKS